MLSKEEEDFIEYWKNNRDREKKTFRQLATGLPVGCVLAVAILVSVFSGWDKRADSDINTSLNPSVLIIALLVIVVFIAIFHKKHQWDQHEEQYKILLKKKEREEKKKEMSQQ
ncbi:MAG: hypothetical protein DI598_12155 [Pseudopedobacter saltans]|uniref:Uncharacterized protein n=1 Tax=Pseudopedobacter saltans TaxID=151895 RepID=A0A2W5EVB4_9SPHI|nr:MAG: hypothetical protein DI598_12155 [Pseudopedobacter saltans]